MAFEKQEPQSRPIAFLSDVHGNLAALDAVLTELRRMEVADVVVAGDLLLGGDEPLGVWRRLERVGARCIRGLSDTALVSVSEDALAPADEAQRAKAQRFLDTRRALGELVIEQLRRLPDRLRIPMIDGREILVVHGSPDDPTQEMSHDMSDDELVALVADDPADLVVCGASHVAFRRDLPELVVLNVGSVGQSPEGRTAHFAVVTPRLDSPTVVPHHVAY